MEKIPKFDRFELKSKLFRFSISVSETEETTKMKNLLKKVVLEELLKSNVNRDFYVKAYKEAIDQLNLGSSETGYPCCLVGCRFLGDKHLKYVRHIKQCHPNMKKIVCNFQKKCERSFSCVEDLVQHLKTSHSKEKTVAVPISYTDNINVPCKCNRLLCWGKQFVNVTELMTHWNTFHCQEERDCIFFDCSTTFGGGSMSRHHFRIKHKHTNLMQLKSRHLVESQEVSIFAGDPSVQPANLPAQSSEDYEMCEDQDDDQYEEEDFDGIENLSSFFSTEEKKE